MSDSYLILQTPVTRMPSQTRLSHEAPKSGSIFGMASKGSFWVEFRVWLCEFYRWKAASLPATFYKGSPEESDIRDDKYYWPIANGRNKSKICKNYVWRGRSIWQNRVGSAVFVMELRHWTHQKLVDFDQCREKKIPTSQNCLLVLLQNSLIDYTVGQ